MAIGKVIKSDSSAPEPASVGRPQRSSVLSSEVFQAKQDSQGIVERGRQTAEEIVEEAKRQREAILKEAREQGRQEGLAQAGEVIARAKIQAGEIIAQAENEILALACKVAEKIIGRDVQRDPALMVEICATAIENVRQAKSLVIRVNPKAAATLRDMKKNLMELIGRAMDVSIKEDADLAPLGCVIQTELGTIDAQLTTQLEMIQRVLLDEGNKRDEKP